MREVLIMRQTLALLSVLFWIVPFTVSVVGQVEGGSTGTCINREGRAEPCRDASDSESDIPYTPGIVKARDFYHQANDELHEGNYEAARDDYKAALGHTHSLFTLKSNLKLRARIKHNLELAEKGATAKKQGPLALWRFKTAFDSNTQALDRYYNSEFKKAVEYNTESLMLEPDTDIYQNNLKNSLYWLNKTDRQAAAKAETDAKQAVAQCKVLNEREDALEAELRKLSGITSTDPVQQSNIKAKIEHVKYAQEQARKATNRLIQSLGQPSMISGQDLIESQKLSEQAFQEAVQDARNLSLRSPWLQ